MAVSLTTELSTEDDSLLAFMARQSDKKALQILLSRYDPFIKSYSEIDGNMGIEADDLMQEGRLGLLSAVRCYRSDGGASFRTYAYLCIKRHIISARRHANRYKNLPMNNYVSLDDDIAKDQISYTPSTNPEDIVISMERLKVLKNALDGMFGEVERQLFSLYILGFSYDDMSEILNVSKKQVDNSLQHIKRKLSLLFT